MKTYKNAAWYSVEGLVETLNHEALEGWEFVCLIVRGNAASSVLLSKEN